MPLRHLLYIDPGIGSLVAQVVIAGFAAGWMFFRNSIRRIFRKSKPKEEEKNNP